MSELGTRPASRIGSMTRRRIVRLRSSQPSRSSASNLGRFTPAGSPPTKSSMGFSSVAAIERYCFSAAASDAADVSGDSRRACAASRMSSQSTRTAVPPRGRTASATAAVAKPARTPNSAAPPTRRLTPPGYATRRNRFARRPYLIDIGPAPVALEDNLAPVTAEHDLELPPPDRRGIAAAHGTGCGLVHEGPRQGIHFYL